MIEFREFFTDIGFKIEETSPYLWECFGKGVNLVDVTNPYHGMSLTTNYDRVFYIDVYFKDAIVCYVDQVYKEGYFRECMDRDIDIHYNSGMYEVGDRIPIVYVDQEQILNLVKRSLEGDLGDHFFSINEAEEAIDLCEESSYTVTVEVRLYASSHAEASQQVESSLSNFGIKSIQTRSNNNV